MAHRAKHRTAAATRRYDRALEGLGPNPSNRQRADKPVFQCPCGKEFRRQWQLRSHVVFVHLSA